MVLLGARSRTSTFGSGTFRCPRESSTRRYELKSVRRWIAIRTMAVVPLHEVTRFVECRSCHSTFEPSVLATPPGTVVEDMLTRSLRRAAAAVLSAGPALGDDARREGVIVLQRYASVPYGMTDLCRDLEQVGKDPIDAELAELAMLLNDHGRRAVLDAGVQLATSDPAGLAARVEALRRVAQALAIPGDQVRAALDRWSQPGLAAS